MHMRVQSLPFQYAESTRKVPIPIRAYCTAVTVTRGEGDGIRVVNGLDACFERGWMSKIDGCKPKRYDK